MQILFFFIIIFLLITIGESNINKKMKKILLLGLSFLYNAILGLLMWFSIFIIAFSTAFLNVFILSITIIVTLFFIFLLPINIYVKRKTDTKTILYIILNLIGLLIGSCWLWR